MGGVGVVGGGLGGRGGGGSLNCRNSNVDRSGLK